MSDGDERQDGQIHLGGLAPLLHPMDGCGYRRFWKHFFQNWPYDLRSLYVRLFAIVAVTVRAPGVWFEGRRHNAKIAAQPLDKGPVFVVGHWRSGTTYLHNLLSQDPQFGWLSFSRSATPLDCLGKVRPTRALINWLVPKTRGMDAVVMNADTPQEEEMALGALGDICFYKCFYFPRKLEHHFRRSVLMQGLRPGEREDLAESYRFLAQKMAYLHQGKTVLFKNPACTARMAFLKEVFPNAKFIHIVRDPQAVYPSMMKLWDRILRAFSWQNPKGIDFSEAIFSIYERTMRAHIEDRDRIPAEDFHEVRFEDLDSDPLATVAGIYDALGLSGKAEAMVPIQSYIDAQQGYQKNTHLPDPKLKAEIAKHWDFAFERWGYDK